MRQGNVFTPASHSVQRGDLPLVPGVSSPGQTPPPLGRHGGHVWEEGCKCFWRDKCLWGGACVAGWGGGVHDRRGHVWWGACMCQGGMCGMGEMHGGACLGRQVCWGGACVAGGLHGGGGVHGGGRCVAWGCACGRDDH